MTEEAPKNGSVSIREVYGLVEQMRRDLVEAMEATRARHHQSMNDITVQLAKLSIRIEDLSKTTGDLEHAIGLKADAVSVQNLVTLTGSIDTRLRTIENGEEYRRELVRRQIDAESEIEKLKASVVSSQAVDAYRKWLFGAVGVGVASIGLNLFVVLSHR